ncbi:rod shape-determining protein RodA, partial [Limosilactobacillus mucosae]|nr:rod shape-determining protein RodA [Limosilactobacillus mucosae]
MQRSQNDNESRIDWGIIFCVLLLALIGLASIYVAAVNDTTPTSVARQVVSQLVWYIIGTILI